VAQVAYLSHPDYELHVQGAGHPERPARVRALREHLPKTDIWSKLTHLTPGIAPVETLDLVHDRSYIDFVKELCERGGGYVGRDWTGTVQESFVVARRAVGAVTRAVDAVLAGEADSAFCAIRPPGHHALRDRGMGFCLFNNVALGARYAQRRHGVERVFIVDWDYHHGNGTQALFWTDPTVFFFSVHCYPAWPYTGRQDEVGAGAGKGATLNAPLPPGAGRDEYLAVFDEVLRPAFERFRPDLVFISAGFDAHAEDPVPRRSRKNMKLAAEDFRALTERVRELAEGSARGRLVSVLEGGYHLPSLVRSVEEHLRGLLA
jgi:acetoin utilization deacetylase AcuC-like enzyme